MTFVSTFLSLFLDFSPAFFMIIVLILLEQTLPHVSNHTVLPQIRAPICHLSSVGLVEKNLQLVISQVRK